MTYAELDAVFPWIVFSYGALLTIVLNIPRLVEIAEKKFPPKLLTQMSAHRGLALICMLVGAVWTLQNIWYQSL